MIIDPHIQEFALELGVTEFFKGNTPDSYIIPLEDGLSVEILPEGLGFAFFSKIAPCPKNNCESFYTHLLLGNLFGQGTHEAVLGLSDDGNLLTLTKSVEYSINYREFKDLLEDFINMMDFWREQALSFSK